MTFWVFAVTSSVLPAFAMVMEWVVGTRLSERHHSKHDTYVISSALTGALALAMLFMGVLGLVLSWLCYVGVFKSSMVTMEGFFFAFVLVMFVMWATLRRYRVATYDDHLEVTPFVGRKRSIKYDEIERLKWARSLIPPSSRSIMVIAGGETKAVLIGTFDLEQILLQINRNDVLDNV